MMTHRRRQSESDGESNSDDETDEISFSMWIRENLLKKKDKMVCARVLQSIRTNGNGMKRTYTQKTYAG